MIDLKEIAAAVRPHVVVAGEMIAKDWNEQHFASYLKDERDVVTDTDVTIEDYLRVALAKILPEAGFIVEEGVTDKKTEYNWAIDPIDGTKYFAANTPLFYTQISLLQGTEPILSFVYQPVSKQLFSAIKGGGAYLNGKLLTPKFETDIKRAIVEFDTGGLQGEANAWKLDLIKTLLGHIYRPRFSSGFLSMYLVTGAIDISLDTNVSYPPTIKNIVDLSSHKLIITEAGFKEETIDFMGHKILVWTSEKLLGEIKLLLHS